MKLKHCLILAASLTLAAAQDRFDLKVRNFFFAGFNGDPESLATGMKLSEEALATDPKNAEALVWHGSGLFFQAGQAFQSGDQQKGGELWQRSMKEMGLAVELAPDNIGVRIPRGAVLLTGSRFLPSPEMARPLVVKAVSDYEKAYELQSLILDRLPNHPKGELLIGLAEGYARLGNLDKAAQFYAKIETEMPGTAYSRKAAQYRETKTVQTGCLGCHAGK